MNSYPLQLKTLVLGAALALILLTAWEVHWRSEGYAAAPDNTKGIWAEQRAKVNKLGPDDFVIIGSSRVLFDFQLDEWEAESGRRPLMLAAAGSSPMPVFEDIVTRSDFNGTLVFGVTPVLFYSPFDLNYLPYKRIANWVDYYHKRTYADRLNYQLSKPLQHSLAFLNTTEEGFDTELDLDRRLKTWLKWPGPPRVMGPPDWPEFAEMDKDRNTEMLDIMTEDPAYTKRVTDFWTFLLTPPPEGFPPPEVMEQGRVAITGFTMQLMDQFKARGGKVILVRCPSQAMFYGAESGGFPRERYWDALVDSLDVPAYHFADYEFMNRYILPEWSHMSAPDARQFTTDFVRQLKVDGLLPEPK